MSFLKFKSLVLFIKIVTMYRPGAKGINSLLFFSFRRDFKQWFLRFLCSNSLGKRIEVRDSKAPKDTL